MPNPFLATGRKSKRLRLWPLMLLPVLGMVAGVYLGISRRGLPLIVRGLDPISLAALGILAGTGAMVACASLVLFYRLAHQRFTIGNILVTIAIIAVFLSMARAIFF
jgi:hypothetical protein